MKGQQEALSAVLISGILIGIVGSVYFWGVPLIQKNKDIALLETSESFMRTLDNKIKTVANNGGRDQLAITVPGLVMFDGSIITLQIETEGTIYATDAQIPLGRTSVNDLTRDTIDPSIINGTWGANDPVLFNVISKKIADNKYKTTYSLEYIQLRNSNTMRDFKINLTGPPTSGGLERTIVVENTGDVTVYGARTLINSNVKVSIV